MRKNHRTLVSLVCAATMILNSGMPITTVNAETVDMAENAGTGSTVQEETQQSGSSTAAEPAETSAVVTSDTAPKTISEADSAEAAADNAASTPAVNETTSTENKSTGSSSAVQEEENAADTASSAASTAEKAAETSTEETSAAATTASEEESTAAESAGTESTEAAKESSTENSTEASSESSTEAASEVTTEATTEATAEETTEETTDETTETTEETTEASTEDTTEEDLSDLPTAEELDAQIKDEEDALETKDETATVTGTAKSGDAVIVGFAGFPLDEGSLEDQAPDIDGYTFNGGITLDGVEVSKIYSEVETKTESREYSIRIDGSDEDATTEAADEGSVAPEKAKEETVTRDVVTEKTKVTKAETANGTITISGDQSVVFTYDEDHTTTTLTAKYVDEFGDPIDKDQESVSVPFAEDKDEITLKDSFPEKLQVAQDDSGKKVKEYTYESTYIRENGEKVNITAIKRVKTDDGYAYQVKKDGSDDYTELESDTTLYVEYNDGQKSEYTYSDVNVTVTATLQHANAIPDDARFIVTQITPATSGYNYDAYMEAMHRVNSDADASNTLLYDIAFLGYSVDADGNTNTAKTIEYEPVNGSVSIHVEFKKNQLSDELNAESAEGVQVTHLPLKDEVRENVVSTKDATSISSNDIATEPVSADVSLEGTDTTSFSLSALSAVGITYTDNGVTYESGLENFLNDAVISGEGVSYDKATQTYTLLPDKNYHFSFQFSEPSRDGQDAQFDNLDNKSSATSLTYTLPNGLTPVLSTDPYRRTFDITVNVDGKDYVLENNHYTLDSKGNLTVNWNKESKNYSYFTKASNARFDLEFDGKFSFQEDQKTIQFSSQVEKTVKIDRTAKATISKKAAFNPKTGKAEYTVDLEGLQGTSTDVVITDTMSGTALTLEPESITVTDSNGNAIDKSTYSKNVDGNKFTLSGLSVSEGQHVYVKYTAAVGNFTGNGTYNETYNKVSFTSKDQNPGEEKYASLQNDINYSSLEKTSGTVTTDANGNQIVPWTIKFNENKYVNAAGVVITDTIDKDSQSYMTYAGSGIHVKKTAPDGTTSEYDVAWTDSSIKKSDTSWSYTIPTTEDKNYSYEITYNTKVETSKIFKDTTVKNTADDGNTPGYGDKKDGTATVKPGEGANFDISKSGIANGTDSITWTVTLTRPEIECDSAYVEDNLPAQQIQKDGSWPTVYDGMPSEKDIQVIGLQTDKGETYSFEPKADNSGFIIRFFKDSEKTKSGLNAPGGENKAITIKYTSTVNKDWLEYTKNYPDTKTHTNNATFHVGNGSKTGSHPVDIVPSTPFQIYKKLYAGRVIKEKDAAGAEHDVNLQSIAEDGTVYFPFQIAITGVDGTKDLVIDDTFDTDALEFYSTNVTINGNSYSYDGSIYQGSAWGIWQSNLINDVKPSIENLSNGIRFTITKEQAKKLADTYGTSVHYYICYCLKLKNAQAFDAAHEDKEAKFTNTARTTEDGTSSAQVDFNYRSEPITKEETAEPRPVNGVWLVDYKIVVNPLGQDLVKGEDNLEVTDTPSDNLVILPDTIQYNGTSTQNFRTDGSKYIFTIPDSQKCVITYQARLKVTESKNYTYNNTASVIGKSSTIPDKTKYITFDGSGSGTASMCSVKLHKFYKDGDQSHSLEGARFALYTDEACTKYAIDGQGNRLLSEKDTNGNEIGVETGTDGYLTIANLTPNSADGKTTHDYYLKEISAPNGYSILSGSIHFQISSDLVITFIGDVPSGVTKNGGYGLYLDVQDGVATETISGTKTWDDSNNQDGKRPESITVRLLADGKEVDSKTVTEKDEWKYSFTDLPKYAGGKEITYTVTEDAVDGYTAAVDGYNIKNTHKTETTTVSGTKTWDDSNNQDGKRPGSITVRLLADGKEVDSKTVTEKDEWKYSFTNLPKYAAGKEIAYTVTEDKVADYTTTINGFDITNTHKTETTSVSGMKTWDDSNNQDGKRPTSITVRLLADGKEVKSTEATEATGWKYSFTDLPKYAAGKEIVYTVAEDEVAGYATTINGYDITNTYTTETTSISGTKTWSDNDNQDGVRPTSITVHLYANGVEAGTKSVTAADGWKYTFDNLPKYADGKVIKYTVTEDEVAGYTTTIKGYNITNTHKTETTSVSGTKTWSDSDNQDGVRPTSIKIHLLADGKEVKSTEVTEASGWKYSFEDLPKYDAGKEIAYTVTEDAVPGYETTINGFDITNTHKTETTSVAGTKTWSDNGNQDGKRPTSITVRLLADGKEVKSTEATEATGWKYSFTDLPKYAAGKEIVYTVAEDEVAGYATTINGYDITNTYTTETTSISGTKTWSDNDNQDGVRPTSITVHLYANGVEAGTKSVTAADGWKYTFDNLPKFADGKEITYTVTEDEVAGYMTTINGFDIINTHKTGLTQVSVRKVWDDNDNEANIRPTSITVQLYADGKAYGNAVTLNEDNKWSYTWSDLAVNAAGKAITYTVDETQVPDGYTKSVTNNETAFTITNTHTITRQKAGSITLTATKNLVGADLQAGDFSFEVLEGSSVVATGTNDASGVVRFTTINYTAVGEHDYTVREAAGSMAGVTYDTTVYNVHVSVTDDGTDTLKVTATGADGMVFTNTYNEDHPHGDTPHDNGGGNTPHHDTTNDFFDEEGDNQNDMPFEDEDSDNQSETIEDDSSNDTPRTGDDSHLLIWFVLIALAATGITGSSIYRKKRRDHENEQQ